MKALRERIEEMVVEFVGVIDSIGPKMTSRQEEEATKRFADALTDLAKHNADERQYNEVIDLTAEFCHHAIETGEDLISVDKMNDLAEKRMRELATQGDRKGERVR